MKQEKMNPKRLQRGDVVGVIAPASPPRIHELQRGVKFLQQLGLQVVLGKHIFKSHGYLAGTDDERLADFHDMIADSKVKAIFSARGGYGTARFAERIDYELIKQHPKIIWGYSDMTYLHLAIQQRSNIITFHGPMIASDLGQHHVNTITKQSVNQLFAPMSIWYSEAISRLQVIVNGKASGQLIGGNLTLITSTLGTPFEIDTIGKILLIEEIGEHPYQVDRMLNQLRLAGKLDEVAGIVVGDFSSITTSKLSLSLQDVLDHYFKTLLCPVMTGFKIGHEALNIGVPLGAQAMLDTKTKTMIVQPGVKR